MIEWTFKGQFKKTIHQEAHSFPRASLLENCWHLKTDNVRGQISEHIFTPNGGYYLNSAIQKALIPSNQ